MTKLVFVAGAPAYDSSKGVAFPYYKDQGGVNNWGQLRRINAWKGQYCMMGYSVAVDGDVIVVGAPWLDWAGGDMNGGAFVYTGLLR